MQKYPYVQVEWTDIVSDPEWTDINQAIKHPGAKCVTVGHLLKVNRVTGMMVIAHTLAAQKNNKGLDCDYTTIPLGAIRRVYRMKRNGEMSL